MGGGGGLRVFKRLDTNGSHFSLKVLIPNFAVGPIMGKGGETITQLQRDTQTNIKLSKAHEYFPGKGACLLIVCPFSNPAFVFSQVTGTEKQMHHCVHRIIDKVLEHPDSGSCLSISYGSMSLPATNSMSTTPSLPATDAVVQPMLIQAGFRGRDLQAASDAVGTLVNLGYSPTTLGLDWNLSIAAGAAVAAAVNDQEANAEEAETAASLETLRSDEVPADATSIEMAVPESIVGVIMGKGGRTLMDYQEATGTRIQLSRKGEFMPGTQNRRVTVWGPASARKVAEFLIKRRVAIEKYMRAASDR
uniref:K Homology domain-containing protein n=1 Tax=Eptatretus burgeri TaxID=7764 RepID=A0A8C4NK89_EPTBU